MGEASEVQLLSARGCTPIDPLHSGGLRPPDTLRFWGFRPQTPVPFQGGHGRSLTVEVANPAHGLPTAWPLEAATAADLERSNLPCGGCDSSRL